MAENPNRPQVVEDIDTLMHVDQPVYDTYGQTIGAVKHFDLTAGYMQVHRGGLEPETFYVPFRLIATIDPRSIYLTVSEGTLIAEYTLLPTSQAVLTEWKNWRTGQFETTVGHQMRSGYSGQPVIAFQQSYAALAGQLRAGMQIRDIEGADLGRLHQFDSRIGWMLLTKGGLGTELLIVPFSAIADVNTANSTVSLLVPKERLQGDLATLLPAQATPAVGEASHPSPPHADA
ncbi:MAG TPA: PRC-barrel domain-containing protein [Ktedonobacterales bacterium]|nr:PRC-barrel domain-containing protein [Ktedonobacterales bacterium]